jgi:S-adenosylmethionine uptake transporter
MSPMMARDRASLSGGILLLLAATIATTLADGVVKDLASRLQAPQVFFLSGALMAGLSVLAAQTGRGLGVVVQGCLRTKRPGLLALRSLATVVAAWGFFYALAQIRLAEVFLFIGLMPLMSAFLSRAILGEGVGPAAWIGMAMGLAGLMMLFPGGVSDISLGHLAGLVGAGAGTVSLVLSRLMARHEANTLVQVFYPNLALAVSALLVLPTFWLPMSLADLALILGYSGLLFLARWGMVLVMRRLPAPVALPLMNIQFVWMVIVGLVFFGERPDALTLSGATLVMLAGVVAVSQQARVNRLAARAARGAQPGGAVIPAE